MEEWGKALKSHLFVFQAQAQKKRHQQHEVIAELRRRQAKDHRPVYEGKDGTIEDIITGGPTRARAHGSAGGGGGGGAGGTSPPAGPRAGIAVVVVQSSSRQQCTLCYVTSTPLTLEQRNATQHHTRID